VTWRRLLLAIDQFGSGQAALELTTQLAASTGADVRVIHLRELAVYARVPPLETPADAQYVVDAAVFSLRIAGVGAGGQACSVRSDRIAARIVEIASTWNCDAIVLGSRRLRGFDRLSGRGVRESIVRLSRLPVVTAPSPVTNGVPGRAGRWLDAVDRYEAR
jgi:nucleotide-binding universal stress UspA family protein